ncbi:MAG: hypothetical protein LC732_01260 [Acidobacteria bacterium]|nr:hypothetical protein [Acidobacteriota bacterium]
MNRLLAFLLFSVLSIPGFGAADHPLIPVDLVAAQDPSGFSVIRHGDGYLLVRSTPRTDGLVRLDVQRISADGTLRDVEPIHLAAGALRIAATKRRTMVMLPGQGGFRLLAFDEGLQPLFERRIPGPFPDAVAATDDRLLMIRNENFVVRAEVWDENGVQVGGSTLFGSTQAVTVGAAPVGDGFIVVANSSTRGGGETRAVRIEESGRAGDVRVIDRARHGTIKVVANEEAALVLTGAPYTQGVNGLILNTNAETQSGPFPIFPDALPYAFTAAGVDGGFLVASQPGVRIGWIPSDGDSVVHSGVLGQPGTFPAAASSGRGDALFVYRSAGIITAKLIGPGLANADVEIVAVEAGAQTKISGASAGETDLAAWIEWSGAEAEARASRIVDGVAIDDPPLVVGPARIPLSPFRTGVAASDSEFVVIAEGSGRRISTGGELGETITPGSGIVDSNGRDFGFFRSVSSVLSARTLLGGTDFLTPWTQLTAPPDRYESLAVSASRERYLLTWDDFFPCIILCPPQRIAVSGAIVNGSETLLVPPFEIMEAGSAISTTDGERFLVAATKGQSRTALALVDPLGRRLDGGSVSEPLTIATTGRLLETWWDGSRFTVATEEALFEVDDDLQLTSVRAIPTTLDGSPYVGFIAPDSLLYTSATGVGEPSGGVPRAWISTLTREPQVDLEVRIERLVHRNGERHQLVVQNQSDTTATGVVLLWSFGPAPAGSGCKQNYPERRCRRDSLAAGAEWRMDLIETSTSDPLPRYVFVGAREMDTNPANNQNPEVVERARARSRIVARP